MWGDFVRLDRATRRRILKEDEPWLGKPLSMEKDSIRAVQANTRHLVMMLRDTALPRRASLAAEFACNILDTTLARKTEGPVACGKGCYYCCKTYVSVTIPEIFRVADAMRDQSAKAARVREAAAASARIHQTEREKQRVVCPILENKACSVYAPRPLVCRAVLSKSLEVCLRIFENNSGEQVPFSDNTVDVRGYVVVMFQSALRLAGLPHVHYEMNQALAVALDQPDAEARWLAGERVFDDVPIDIADLGRSSLADMADALVANVAPTL